MAAQPEPVVERRDCWECDGPTPHLVSPAPAGLRRCQCQVCGTVYYYAPPLTWPWPTAREEEE